MWAGQIQRRNWLNTVANLGIIEIKLVTSKKTFARHWRHIYTCKCMCTGDSDHENVVTSDAHLPPSKNTVSKIVDSLLHIYQSSFWPPSSLPPPGCNQSWTPVTVAADCSGSDCCDGAQRHWRDPPKYPPRDSHAKATVVTTDGGAAAAAVAVGRRSRHHFAIATPRWSQYLPERPRCYYCYNYWYNVIKVRCCQFGHFVLSYPNTNNLVMPLPLVLFDSIIKIYMKFCIRNEG